MQVAQALQRCGVEESGGGLGHGRNMPQPGPYHHPSDSRAVGEGASPGAGGPMAREINQGMTGAGGVHEDLAAMRTRQCEALV